MSDSATHEPLDITLHPEQLEWDGDARLQRQVLHEDPAHGVVTARVRIPPHQTLQPHGVGKGYFIATVISGTLQLGFGDCFDEAALRSLPAGSIFTHPAGRLHFARTGAEAVILQLTSVGR